MPRAITRYTTSVPGENRHTGSGSSVIRYTWGATTVIGGSIPAGGRFGQNAMYAASPWAIGAVLDTCASTVTTSPNPGDSGEWLTSVNRIPGDRGTVPAGTVNVQRYNQVSL